MIAFVTCREWPNLIPDDQELLKLCDSKAVIWDDDVDWSQFSKIILRSPWDYHEKIDKFLAWLESISGLSVVNPISTIKKNLNKRYLFDLERKGIKIPSTQIAEIGQEIDTDVLLKQNNWPKMVVKPIISAGARDTFVIESGKIKAKETILLQPYLPEIENGEWAFIFFAGKFSHAVLKKPKTGDFRVQPQFGGFVASTNPDKQLINQAYQIIEAIEDPWLYCRVDGLDINGQLVLMELELIEPRLFFEDAPGAAERFIKLVVD